MRGTGFIGQHRSNDRNGLNGPFEELATWNQEGRTRQHRELVTRETVHDRADTRPVHLPDAHGTRFTTGVKDRTLDLVTRQLSNRRGQEVGFSVRGRVPVGDDRVHRGQDDLAVQRQQGSEWVVAVATSLTGESDRLSHKALVRVQRHHDAFEVDTKICNGIMPCRSAANGSRRAKLRFA
jgi:hypothetical protein